MSKASKGNYYVRKTKQFLEAEGYLVEKLEVVRRIFTKDKRTGKENIIFSKKDLWGADLIAKNNNELIFIQVKSNKGDIAKGIKEIEATIWPPHIKRWVVFWEVRAKEPDIIDASR